MIHQHFWDYIWRPKIPSIEDGLRGRLELARECERLAADWQALADQLQELADEIRRLP